MFKNKLLKALLAPFFVFEGDPDAGGGGASDSGGFNIDAAVSAIGEGLGFGGGDDDGGDGTGADGSGAAGDDLDSGNPGEKGGDGGAGTDDPAGSGDGTGGTPPTPAGEVPKTWRPEAAAEWAKLSPTVQAEILKREQDIFQGLEAYKADANYAKGFKNVFAPYEPLLKQVGADPVALTQEFLQAHMTFAAGTPEQKQALLNRIIQDYGLEPPGGAAAADGEPPYTDPTVKALQDEIKALKSQISGVTQQQTEVQQARAQEIRTKLAAEIDAFAKDPAHGYFNELADDITGFIKLGLGLQQAYDKAVWANPATRAKEQARLTAEAEAKAKKEAAEKVQKARSAAAANVRTSAKNASGTAPLGSIDDTLKETYAKIVGKS